MPIRPHTPGTAPRPHAHATRLLVLAAALLMPLAASAAPLSAGGGAFTRAPASGETAAERELRAGLQAQLRGDLATARRHFEATLKLEPRQVQAMLGLAALAQAEGRRSDTERWLRSAESTDARSPLVHLAWGRHHAANGQFDRAERSLNKAHELAPATVPPLLELGDLYLRAPGRTNDALRAFSTAARIAPDSPHVHYGLGVAYAAAGRRDDALQSLARAAEMVPGDPAPLRAAGRLHLEAGAAALALQSFDEGLRRQPEFLPLMLDRVDALAALARWDEAVSQLQAAEQRAPRLPELQLKFGDVLQAAQRPADAEPHYLKAITLAPQHPVAYNNLAWLIVAQGGDAARAVSLAQQAVTLSPRSSPLHDTLGWAQRAAGDLAAAEASLRRAIELEPGVAGYHYHLGVVLAERRHHQGARGALQRALELDGNGPHAADCRQRLAALQAG